MSNNKPIVPVFSANRINSSERVKGSMVTTFFYGNSTPRMIPDGEIIGGDYEPMYENEISLNTLKMSLDGERFYSMERIEELIELGLQYEYAIESLAVENDDEQRN
jgi:hypothetical protein